MPEKKWTLLLPQDIQNELKAGAKKLKGSPEALGEFILRSTFTNARRMEQEREALVKSKGKGVRK